MIRPYPLIFLILNGGFIMNKESIIGESIICSGLGIGQITDITHLTEGGEEFYKVNF